MTVSPAVSILMVACNSAPFIDAAVRSARAQTAHDIEIVVVDDGSTDGTAKIVQAHAHDDPRVRLLAGPKKGLSAVRNASLDAARGRYAVILDSDDMLHPGHIAGLLLHQSRGGAVICASNMVQFSVGETEIAGRPFVAERVWCRARSISIEKFLKGGMIGSAHPSLGYLKPMFDLAFLRSKAIRYDERLRIGEDFDLVLRALLAGANYHFLPQATYYYRRHAGSTSHRLTTSDVCGLMKATHGYKSKDASVRALLKMRLDNLEGAHRQLEAISALRRFRPLAAWQLAMPHSHARTLLFASLAESVLKRLGIHWGKHRRALRPAYLAAHMETIAGFIQPWPPTPLMERQCAP